MLKNRKLIILISEIRTFRHFHLIKKTNKQTNKKPKKKKQPIFCREIYCALGDLWSTIISKVWLPQSSVSPKPGDLLVPQTWLYYSRCRCHVVLAMQYPGHVEIVCIKEPQVIYYGIKVIKKKWVHYAGLHEAKGTHIYIFNERTKKVRQQSVPVL